MGKSMILRPDSDFSLIKINGDRQFIQNLVDLNAKAGNYGLVITEAVAREIAVYRSAALTENERFETNSNAISRLTSAFLETRYLNQDDFASTIGEIINLFYLIKNETGNLISDDDLICELLKVFTETCFGSLEIMQSKGLEKILRKYKFGDANIWDDYENINWEDYYDTGNESWRE